MGELKILGGGGGVAGLKTLQYEYSGTSNIEYIDEEIDGKVVTTWVLKLLSSGTLKMLSGNALHNDLYVVGGGGGGGGGTFRSYGGGGGGGGYISEQVDHRLEYGADYPVIIGGGGTGGKRASEVVSDESECNGGDGGQSSAFGITANGGKGGSLLGNGGDGGSGGGPSAANPYSTGVISANVGKGSGKSTRIMGTLYSGGGAGGGGSPISYGGAGGSDGSNGYPFNTAGQTNGAGGAGGGGGSDSLNGGAAGAVNSGGGGGGGFSSSNKGSLKAGGAGGSGIVIIVGRNY